MTTRTTIAHRRLARLTAGVAALVAVTLLAACGSSDSPSEPAAGGTAGPSAFTDDQPVTITPPDREIRVVAQEDAANALYHFGIKPVGIFGGAPIADNPQLEGVEVTGIESVGEVFGEVNLEKLAALKPDFIVTTLYTGDGGQIFEGGLFGFGTAKMQENAKAIAPLVAINASQPASKIIERFAELATALGADLDAAEIVQAKQRYETSVTKFKEAVAKKPGLTVEVLSGAADQAYIAAPALFADLQDFKAWGLDVITPTGKMVSAYYEAVSWENADKYKTDVVLYDSRSYVLGPKDLAKFPTWSGLPAVKADQIGPWARIASSYQIYAAHIEELTTLIDRSRADVV